MKDRLNILEATDTRESHIEKYNHIDIALDPMPYGGATTTCESLSMGVPVITFAGNGMVGRLTASILQSANLNKYIARSLKDYVELAKLSYKEGIRNIEERKRLREEVRRSNLGVSERVAKYIEQICSLN